MVVTEIGQLNTFYVNETIQIKDLETNIATAFLTNASLSQFQDLYNQFMSENDKFSGLFMVYLAKNGFYATVLKEAVYSPDTAFR
jgi:hypothetical protein